MTENKGNFTLEDEILNVNGIYKNAERSKKINEEATEAEPITFVNVIDSTEMMSTARADDNGQQALNNKQKHGDYKERENWVGKADFFLSALAYAVGLGAVWRFPYLCYKNGGGVFLIPYFFFLFVIGIPLVFLEMSVGQFTSTGPLTCWRMAPILRGIGLSMNIVNGYLCIYYNMILAYALFFLYKLFATIAQPNLPWSECHMDILPSSGCVDNFTNIKLFDCSANISFIKCPNGRCYDNLTHSLALATCQTQKFDLKEAGLWKIDFPSQDYWSHEILNKTSTIEETGHIVWQLVIALLFAWIIVYLMVLNGIKVSGKLVYFTALFPYVVLLILGINGWMLKGADIGIKYYIYPDFSRLRDYTVWTDAAVQIFFTLSVSYGGLIALSSYNKFHTNILRDAIVVSLSNCLTSVFAGFVIFSYMGSLAYYTNQDIKNIVQAGQGLAYVVYPFAVTTLKGAKFWAFLFFFMMLVLGLDTMMASVETMITSVFDILPKLRRTRTRRVISISIICLILFSIGILFCFQSGTYWIEIFDSYSGSWAVLMVACLECIAVSWIYGFERFKNDISTMIGTKLTNHWTFSIWRWAWCIVSPALLLAVAILRLIDSTHLESNGYSFPLWSTLVGNALSFSTFIGVISWAGYALIDALFINKRPLKTLFEPDSGWRPIKAEHRIIVCLAHESKKLEKEKATAASTGKSNECFNAIDTEKY